MLEWFDNMIDSSVARRGTPAAVPASQASSANLPAAPAGAAPPAVGGPRHGVVASGLLRSATAAAGQALAEAVLDEMDHPMLLVTAQLGVLFANRAAQTLFDGSAPFTLQDGRLQAQSGIGTERLERAVEAAALRGLRSLLTLPRSGPCAESTLAVVPLKPDALPEAQGCVLLVAGKTQVCQDLTLDCFARERGLTPGESRVMRGLSEGLSPEVIAQQHGVAVSTVRTQISSLRAKTGTGNVSALVRKLATLPPLMNALRCRLLNPDRA